MTDLIYSYKNEDPSKEKTTAANARMELERKYAKYLTDDLSQAKYVVVHGGDGTMLGALKKVAEYQVAHPDAHPKVIGLNYGDIGYYMNAPTTDIFQLAETSTTVNLHPLEAHFRDVYGTEYKRLAFNEVVVHRDSRSGQSCHLDVLSNGKKACHDIIKGDGVIVATPIGSRAYYYDAGAEPFAVLSHLIGIQPICDRISADRIGGPYPDSQKVVIKVLNRNSKRPAYGNTDNDERIDHVVQCDVQKTKRIAVRLMVGPTSPVWHSLSRERH